MSKYRFYKDAAQYNMYNMKNTMYVFTKKIFIFKLTFKYINIIP